MNCKKQVLNVLVHINPCAATAVLTIAVAFALIVALTESAPAQTGVVYNFTGQADGAYPTSGLTPAGEGTFYGTTCGQVCGSGTNSNGTVFRLSKQGSGWVLTTLYSFQGGSDGSAPISRVLLGPGGVLYGTTLTGGIDGGCNFYLSSTGCGTVYKLSPPNHVAPNAVGGRRESADTAWTESVLYRFTGGADGGNPFTGDLIFDQAGNLYGTTAIGGSNLAGVVYELTPTSGGWTEAVLYSFGVNGADANPLGGVIFDGSGNLYGSEFYGGGWGGLCGAVFQLTPSGSSWTENILYGFQCSTDGANPIGGVTFDQNGNLYGTTSENTIYNWTGGTLFMLNGTSGWNFSLLWNFTGGGGAWSWPSGPWTSLTATDGASGYKNFYGTASSDGNYPYYGSIFSWTYDYPWGYEYSALWNFGQVQNDGAYPISSVAFNGNDGYAYVTTQSGGTNGLGTVFRASY